MNITYLLLLKVFRMSPGKIQQEHAFVISKLNFSSIQPNTATSNSLNYSPIFSLNFMHYDCSIVEKST